MLNETSRRGSNHEQPSSQRAHHALLFRPHTSTIGHAVVGIATPANSLTDGPPHRIGYETANLLRPSRLLAKSKLQHQVHLKSRTSDQAPRALAPPPPPYSTPRRRATSFTRPTAPQHLRRPTSNTSGLHLPVAHACGTGSPKLCYDGPCTACAVPAAACDEPRACLGGMGASGAHCEVDIGWLGKHVE